MAHELPEALVAAVAEGDLATQHAYYMVAMQWHSGQGSAMYGWLSYLSQHKYWPPTDVEFVRLSRLDKNIVDKYEEVLKEYVHERG